VQCEKTPPLRRLYASEPPQISRDLLVLGLAYRLQEIDQGGPGKATRRKLKTIAKNLRKTGRVGPTSSLALKPGARLVREWRGRTHTVTVTEDGGLRRTHGVHSEAYDEMLGWVRNP
jgi:hypothetical protein